jgi:hypothetical protein
MTDCLLGERLERVICISVEAAEAGARVYPEVLHPRLARTAGVPPRAQYSRFYY